MLAIMLLVAVTMHRFVELRFIVIGNIGTGIVEGARKIRRGYAGNCGSHSRHIRFEGLCLENAGKRHR